MLSARQLRAIGALLLVSAMLQTIAPPAVLALPAPQDPSTEAIIDLEADGIDPFDATTFDLATGANAGTDGGSLNGYVRNFDAVTYNVEISLNDADDTNLVGTVTLNDKATWAAVPEECKTVALGFAVVPDSTITDTTGDGLFDTLVCNLGDHAEGTKLIIKPVALAAGNNTDLMSASVVSSSDNNVNLTGQTGTQGDGPVETVITAGFGIGINKMPCGYPEQNAHPNETDCTTRDYPTGTLVDGSPDVQALDWHIALNYDTGSEFVADNGAGTQDFIITDTWVGTHSNDTTINSNNAAGDYDDQIGLMGDLTGVAADSCDFVTPITGATVTCTQAGAGQPITIALTGIPVNQQPLANIRVSMAILHSEVFEPNGDGSENYDINNTADLTGWGGTGTLVTSGTGTVDPGPHTATEDFIVGSVPPGPFQLYKTFDSLSSFKTGQRAAAPGDIVETSLSMHDHRTYPTIVGLCDTIDTTVFEFAGNIPLGQNDGVSHGLNSPYGAANGQWNPVHTFFNPTLAVASAPDFAGSGVQYDALLHGASVEFSDVDYATTGDDHWSATCENDLTGDGVSDWVTDYTTLPGGVASVVRIRFIWDRDPATFDYAGKNRSTAIFSFDLMVKPTAPVGQRIPNTAATLIATNPTVWSGPEGWLGTTRGTYAWNVYENVEDDPTNPLFSFNTTNADRVLVVPASMRISKANNPLAQGPVVSGDMASFTIDPSVSGSGPADQTMTFTDTLPPALSYLSDDCLAAYAAAGLTCSSAVAGQTVTWTVTGYTIGDDLPPFVLDTAVAPGTPAGTYTNTVVISSGWANLSDDSYCDDAVDRFGNPDPAAVAACKTLFARPHVDSASVLVVAEAGVRVEKADDTALVEPLSPYLATLSYANLGGGDVGVGTSIDILPLNGDGVLAPNYSPQRFNFENPANANTATQTADPDGAADYVAIAPSAAGETFEYSIDAPTTIDHRPCHPDNWPAGDDETTNATIALVCARGLIDPTTDVPTFGTPGTGATTWGPLPADPTDVTAIRVSTPAFPGGQPQRDLLLTMNTAYAVEGDLFCNNFGANADIVTLDIISNDVCAEVVAGSIGDFVWHDANQDGVQDGSEDPMPGVDMKLLVEDPNNPGTFIPFQVPDPNNPGSFIDYVVTTDANGAYLFENLPSGNYQVMVDTSTLPPDAQQTYDANGGLDHLSDVTLYGPNNPETPDSVYTDVDDNSDQDFGYDWPKVDLALTKATTATTVFPGQDITYTLTVHNQGEVAMSSVDVVDYLPAGLVISVADSSGWTTDGTTPTVGGETGTLYATVPGPLAPAATVTIDIVVTVQPGATAGDLVNTAEISGMTDDQGRDRTGDDVDSSADDTLGNDPGGSVGTDEDGHINDDGTDANGDGITDEDDADPALVTLVLPEAGIDIEKATNGVQSDEAPGESITVGDPVTWTYDVTNTGSTALLNATVTDSQGVTVDCGNGTNVIPLLLPGDIVTCTGTGTATSGPYTNNATVSGDPALPNFATCGCNPLDSSAWPTDPTGYGPAFGADGQTLGPVADEDPSHYVGLVDGAAIDIEKATNGVDSDNAPGEIIAAGTAVTWTYQVTNIGSTALANATVTDSQGVIVDCDIDGDGTLDGTNIIPLLTPGASVACEGTGTAQSGPYENNSTVTGEPIVPDSATCGCDPADPGTWPTDPADYTPALDETGNPLASVSDEDPSHYTGTTAEAGIDLEKATNGNDSDAAPGETIQEGDPVNWTYEVTNTGTTALLDVTVTDNQGVAIDCAGSGSHVIALLAPGETVVCDGIGIAGKGDYANIGTATGTPAIPDFTNCGCDPADPTTWPNDPADYTPATGPDGQPMGPVTDEDPSHYTGTTPTLAFTGSAIGRLLSAAATLLLAGGLLVIVTRRRRVTTAAG